MSEDKRYTIAVDFDGTLTTKQIFPAIGEPRLWMIEQVKKWKKQGHQIVLWTCRTDIYDGDISVWKTGNHLTDAVEWCKQFGLEFDAHNENVLEKTLTKHKFGRKVFADFYVDDSAVIFNDDDESMSSLNGRILELL